MIFPLCSGNVLPKKIPCFEQIRRQFFILSMRMQNVQKSILQGECCPRMHCEMADDVREMLIITFFQY